MHSVPWEADGEHTWLTVSRASAKGRGNEQQLVSVHGGANVAGAVAVHGTRRKGTIGLIIV